VPSLSSLASRIVECRLCPRLVSHREAVAARPPRRYRGQRYWARPITGFGDPSARLLIVGLAPAAHGGNRTGRIFTGDGSAIWLARSLHESGFATQPTSTHRGDGFALRDAWLTAAVRCAPPANKPTREEFDRCQPFLESEMRRLGRVRVVVALGRIAWDAYLKARRAVGQPMLRRKPAFAHGAAIELPDGTVLIGSYHPSQQNTFTGRLTRPMLRAVFRKAHRLLNSGAG
jgi:uracil-DNA glycosylase family 4